MNFSRLWSHGVIMSGRLHESEKRSVLPQIFVLGTLCFMLVGGLFIGVVFVTARNNVDTFYKDAIPQTISLYGTFITVLMNAYVINRQQYVQNLIEETRADNARQLEQLKTQLDVQKTAYRELIGAAALFFYSLRRSGLSVWDTKSIDAAEDQLIQATRHLIGVDGRTKKLWLDFWHHGQQIYREVRDNPAIPLDKKNTVVADKMEETVSDEDPSRGKVQLSLRDRYAILEEHTSAQLANAGVN